MKTKNFQILFAFIVGTLLISCSKEEPPTPPRPADPIIEISDANFKAALLANADINTNKDGEIQEKEALAFKGKLDVNGKKIESLTGVEAFTNITELDCSKNSLTRLNISKNTKITALYCQENKIKTVATAARKVVSATQGLVLSQNTALTTLNCSNNELEALDLSKNTALTELNCSNNTLKNIDLSKNKALTNINLSSNKFIKINLSKNTSIKIINASNNPVLEEIDIANGNNEAITSVNVTENPKLVTIKVDDIDTVSNNWKKDETATYQDEETTTVVNIPDANFKTALLEHGKSIVADESYKNISTIDTNGDGEIQVKEAKKYNGTIKVITSESTPEEKKITDLTGIEAFVNLTELWCDGNSNNEGKIESINLSKNTMLKKLSVRRNNISKLDLSENLKIEYLDCEYNKINDLETSGSSIKYFLCNDNLIENLNLQEMTSLRILDCDNNKLSSIDISNNPNLRILNCSRNNILSIDISNNPNLTSLIVSQNQITSLDVSSNTALTGLYCKDNPNLTCIQVNQNQLTNIPTGWKKDTKARYSLDCDSSDTNSIITSEGTLTFTDAPNLNNGAMSLLASCVQNSTIYIGRGHIFEYNTTNPSTNKKLYTNNLGDIVYSNIESTSKGLWIFNGNPPYNNQLYYSGINLIKTNGEFTTTGVGNPNMKKLAGSAVWNDKIYVFGGSSRLGYSNKLYSFDTNTLQWQELAPMPEAKECRGEIINGKIYVIGGYNGQVSKRIDVYDIATNKWTYLGDIPYGISAYATTTSNHKIWFVGDYSKLTNVASFDVRTHEFKTYTTNMNPRRHCAAEWVNGKLYVLGGNSASGLSTSTNSVQVVNVE